MIKRILPVVISLVLIVTGSVQAEEANVLSVSEVVSLALEESVAHQIAQVNLDNAKVSYQKSMADNLLNQSVYNRKLAEYNLMKAETAYRNSVADVVINAVNQFGEVALAQMNLEIAELELTLRQREYDTTKQKVATQNASELELLQGETNLANAKFAYRKAQDALLEAQQNLEQLIGLNGVSVDGVLEFTPFTEDLADILNATLENSVAIKEAEENVNLAKLELEKSQLENVAPLTLREVENNLRLAELELERTKKEIVQSVTAAFNAVNQAALNYQLAVQSCQLESRSFAIVEKQVSAGLKTENDLIAAKAALKSKERAQFEALKNYIVTYLQLEKTIDRDLRDTAVLPKVAVAK